MSLLGQDMLKVIHSNCQADSDSMDKPLSNSSTRFDLVACNCFHMEPVALLLDTELEPSAVLDRAIDLDKVRLKVVIHIQVERNQLELLTVLDEKALASTCSPIDLIRVDREDAMMKLHSAVEAFLSSIGGKNLYFFCEKGFM